MNPGSVPSTVFYLARSFELQDYEASYLVDALSDYMKNMPKYDRIALSSCVKIMTELIGTEVLSETPLINALSGI